MNGITPDITIYVKVNAEIAAARIMQRNAALTSFEKEKHEFIQKLIAVLTIYIIAKMMLSSSMAINH